MIKVGAEHVDNILLRGDTHRQDHSVSLEVDLLTIRRLSIDGIGVDLQQLVAGIELSAIRCQLTLDIVQNLAEQRRTDGGHHLHKEHLAAALAQEHAGFHAGKAWNR